MIFYSTYMYVGIIEILHEGVFYIRIWICYTGRIFISQKTAIYVLYVLMFNIYCIPDIILLHDKIV